MAFDDPARPLPADVLAVRDHPAFPAAMRALAATMLAQSDTDRGLAAMFKDGGRYTSALCASAMREEGVTLPRLKALCARFGMLSAGRAHAMLIYLRWLGYVEFWSERHGRGAARYRLSDSFVAAWRTHLTGALQAAARLDPVAQVVSDRIGDDRWFDSLNRHHLDQLVDAIALMPRLDDVMAVFINRDAGTQVVWGLLTLCPEGECPPSGALRPGLERLAARFGVSATHLKRMLRDARTADLIEDTGRGEIRFTEHGRRQLATIYAAQFVRLLAACRLAVAECAPSPAAPVDARTP